MERLTMYYKEGEEPYLSCERCGKTGISECWTQENCTQTAVDRLAVIEDILGDDYDLDRLRELVELTKNIPHVCRFCVGCEMEPKDGHGCDEYDSFVFSTRRLRELVEADRDGRCVVLPCKIGDTLYRIQRFKRGKNWRKEAEYIRTAELNKNNFWRVVFEGELGETVFITREAADAALKGDQHEQNL